jgi:predicted ATPase
MDIGAVGAGRAGRVTGRGPNGARTGSGDPPGGMHGASTVEVDRSHFFRDYGDGKHPDLDGLKDSAEDGGMKIKSVELKKFKRFTHLRVEGIPAEARLIILAGPNGSGKSSFFEGLFSWYRHTWSGLGLDWQEDYHEKQIEELLEVGADGQVPPAKRRRRFDEAVTIEWHSDPPDDPTSRRKAVYVRSAYRNDPDFMISSLSRMGTVLEEQRISRFIENDATVTRNYQRLASSGLRAVYKEESPDTTIGAFRERTIGEIKRSMARLFPDLTLNDLGDPLEDGTFFFDKGASRGFRYQNLSGGEKSAFDLILDLIIKRKEYDDTVFCIDEPEAHMNTRLQGPLLGELYTLVPEHSQLWIATHSIGMMRHARDLAAESPEAVVFLDFGDRDFDEPTVIQPERPDRTFWQRVLNVALDDLADLVAPERVVICEGTPGSRLDADCYDTIFAEEFPETKFYPGGGSKEVEQDRVALMQALNALVRGVKTVRLIDRDDHSEADVREKVHQGVRVLSERNLETMLFSDEILEKLCLNVGRLDQWEALRASKQKALADAEKRGSAPEDMKPAARDVFLAARKLLRLQGAGNDYKRFMRATLAPLVRPDTATYQRLRGDIFGEDPTKRAS